MVSAADWIEKLSAIHRSTLRRFAQQEALQLVHLEILIYLARCNRYSNTTQAISEYLGQTKGSISQSLSHLEDGGFVRRQQDENDKRVFHLSITAKSRNLVNRFDEFFKAPALEGKADTLLENFLLQLQAKNEMKGFGVCRTCKYNQNPGKSEFVCGLTKEKLTAEETLKICREHEVVAG